MKKLPVILLTCALLLSLALPAGAAGPEGKSVSLMTANLSSVTTNQMIEYMKAGLEEAGVNVTVVDTKGDFGQLASRIEDGVSAKADAIVIVSADPGLLATQLEMAFEAGVPVFGCDSGFMEGMMVNATSDNYKMGETITKYLFDELMGGKGTVIALTHRPHPGVVKRSEAFDALLAEYPDITLITEQHVDVPGPIDSARTTMENLILANSAPDSITAVWCAWDEPAIGATQALTDAGRNEVLVIGVDGNSQAVELINEDTTLKATMGQNFEGMAGIVVTEIVKLFNGQEVTPGDQYAPALLITKD
jgi:ribose transport system substrate-binding protein